MALHNVYARQFPPHAMWYEQNPDGVEVKRAAYNGDRPTAIQQFLGTLLNDGATLIAVVNMEEEIWVYYRI